MVEKPGEKKEWDGMRPQNPYPDSPIYKTGFLYIKLFSITKRKHSKKLFFEITNQFL